MNRHQRRAAKAQTGWLPLEPSVYIPKSAAQKQAMFDHTKACFPHYSDAMIWDCIAAAEGELGELWKNDQYQVHLIRHAAKGPRDCDVIQLSIKRLDQQPARDWRDFQRIKDQLVGPEHEAVELYPARSRLVDTANQFHLWCVDDPRFRWPIGYFEKLVSGESGGGAVQRPFEDFPTDTPSTGDEP